MKINCWILIYLLPLLVLSARCKKDDAGSFRVLIFSKTAGFRHSSIANGKTAILQLASKNNFFADTTENAGYFTNDSLKRYAAVIFLSTTGDVLNNDQQAAFEKFIQAGGGYAGVHAAADCEYNWVWYGRLTGGRFTNHPDIQEARLTVVNTTHASTRDLPKEWTRKDEWYNFNFVNPDINALITIDENSYQGGANGNFHPVAWYHEYDGGRSFYTALGHTEESFQEENFLKHLLGGIKYAAGRR